MLTGFCVLSKNRGTFSVAKSKSQPVNTDLPILNKGLLDVVDYVDLLSVANKAIKDDRIDTKDFESYTTEKIITKCCEQLGITTANNSIYNQSQSLLTNLNARDRQIIADAVDSNQDSNRIR